MLSLETIPGELAKIVGSTGRESLKDKPGRVTSRGPGSGRAGRPADTGATFLFALGARVSHPQRGPGEVVEHLSDGRTRIRFDAGDEHRYKPTSLGKISAEDASSTNVLLGAVGAEAGSVGACSQAPVDQDADSPVAFASAPHPSSLPAPTDYMYNSVAAAVKLQLAARQSSQRRREPPDATAGGGQELLFC